MDALGHHIRLRLEDDRVIAPGPENRRVVTRVVLAQARREHLLAFRLVDTHLHIEVGCGREAAGRLAQRIEGSLRKRLELRFVPAYVKLIQDQQHLNNTFRYVLDQERHHGLDTDPFHDGSNLPDLLGLRVLGQFTAENVRALLPRITRRDLLGYLGLPDLDGSPIRYDHLEPAAAAAAGLGELRGSTSEVVAARSAAVRVAGDEIPLGHLAGLLDVSIRTVQRIRSLPVDERLVVAVRRQLWLRSWAEEKGRTAEDARGGGEKAELER